MLGPLVIEAANPDFHLFGPPLLNISTFAAVVLLFGVLVVPIGARFAHSSSNKPLSRFPPLGRAASILGILTRVASSILGILAVVAVFRLLLVGLENRLAIDVPLVRSIPVEMFNKVRLADDQIAAILLLLWVLLILPAWHWLVRGGRMSIVTGGPEESTRRATIIGYVVLAVPCLFGVILLVRAGVVIIMAAS